MMNTQSTKESPQEAPPASVTPIAPHMTQAELALRWQISTATLERWRCEQIGPPFLKLHGQVHYRAADIDAFEEGRLRSSTSTPVHRRTG